MKKSFQPFIFLLVLLILLVTVSIIFIPKDTTKEAGMLVDPCYRFLAEPKNSIDVVFLGNSLPLLGICPPVIWQTHGIPSYVCAAPSAPIQDVEEYFNDFLTVQSPTVVMLEADALFGEDNELMWERNQIYRLFPVLAFHDNWKKLSISQMLAPFHYTSLSEDKGSTVWKRIRAWNGEDYVKPTDKCGKLSAETLKILHRMKARCDDIGAQFILLYTPSPEYWSYKRYNTLVRTAEELDVTYLDLNILMGNTQMDWRYDTCDEGCHLSWWGAYKISKYLGEYLSEICLLENKQQSPSYTDWNDSCTRYITRVEEQKTDNETDYEPPLA